MSVRQSTPREHNYKQEVLRLIAEGKIPSEPGTLSIITVEHDDWCAIYSDSNDFCNCNPWILLNGKRLK